MWSFLSRCVSTEVVRYQCTCWRLSWEGNRRAMQRIGDDLLTRNIPFQGNTENRLQSTAGYNVYLIKQNSFKLSTLSQNNYSTIPSYLQHNTVLQWLQELCLLDRRTTDMTTVYVPINNMSVLCHLPAIQSGQHCPPMATGTVPTGHGGQLTR